MAETTPSGASDGRLTPDEVERIRRIPLTPAMLDVLARWKAEGYDLDTPLTSDFADVPQGPWSGASRYDTDTEHVLSLWREDGTTFDLRKPRPPHNPPQTPPNDTVQPSGNASSTPQHGEERPT